MKIVWYTLIILSSFSLGGRILDITKYNNEPDNNLIMPSLLLVFGIWGLNSFYKKENGI